MSKFSNVLKKAKKKAGQAKPRKKSPSASIPEISSAVDEWLEGKRQEKTGKAKRLQAEEEILPAALRAKRKASREDGEFHSSIDVNDKVKVKTQNKYSPIDSDEEENVREVVGDKFDSWFKESTDVSFNSELLRDEEAMGSIIEAIGEENFSKYFTVKQVLVPTKTFHEQIELNDDAAEAAEALKNDGILKPYKASISAK